MITTQTIITATNTTINCVANRRFARARDTIAAVTKTAKTTTTAKSKITTNPNFNPAFKQLEKGAGERW
eukprot:1222-Ditylum_brightwellii.AAC.1